MTFCISQEWQNNAGLLWKGVSCHHAYSLEEPADLFWGEGSAFGPGNHGSCTLSFKQDSESGFSL